VGGGELGDDLLQLELRACRLEEAAVVAANCPPSLACTSAPMVDAAADVPGRVLVQGRGPPPCARPPVLLPHGPALQRGETSSRC
jgi:hypothetical protein